MTAKQTPEQRRQHALQEIEYALEDRTEICQQIAQALGEVFFTTEEPTERLAAVLEEHPYWVDDLRKAQKKLDTAMREAVHAGVDIAPYDDVLCGQTSPHAPDSCPSCIQLRQKVCMSLLWRLRGIGDSRVREWMWTDKIFHRSRNLRTLRRKRRWLSHDRQEPMSKEDVALAKAWCDLKREGKSGEQIFRTIEAMRKKGELKARRQNSSEALRKWAHDHHLSNKKPPVKLYAIMKSIVPQGATILFVVWPKENEDYNIAVVVPDAMSSHEVGELSTRLLGALANYDSEAATPTHYPLTICRVWRQREWEGLAEQEQENVEKVAQLATREVTLQEALDELTPRYRTEGRAASGGDRRHHAT